MERSLDDDAETWPDELAAALTSCAATQCANADDAECASTCDATREDAPVCREVDCSSCLAGASQCAPGQDCSERVCVLCGWPDDGGDVLGACRGSTSPTGVTPSASVVTAARGTHEPPAVVTTDASSRRAAWALYEIKDHRYHLLLSGDLRGPARTRPVEIARERPTSVSLRDRVGRMGILALIGAARANHDGAVASIFSTGVGFDESVRSSLLVPVPVQTSSAFAHRGAVVWERFASDPGDLSTHSGRPLPAHAKRAAPVTARVAGDDLIDIDGQVDTEHVARVLQRRKAAFQACYEHALKSNAELSGKLLLDFDVGSDGRVTSAALVRDDVASPALARCVLATLERIRFPAQQAEERFLTASLSFQRRP